MEKYKVLVIEDNLEDYIKIQENLISENGVSRLPFDMEITSIMSDTRRKYLRELNTSLDDKVKAEDCLSEMEQAFTTLLRVRGGFHEAEAMIDKIIKENYHELRLIICDLKLCENDTAGAEIIRHLRQDRIIEDIPWYLKNIPIIILTGVDGLAVSASQIGGINCRAYKKIDVLYTMRETRIEGVDDCNIDTCMNQLETILDAMKVTNMLGDESSIDSCVSIVDKMRKTIIGQNKDLQPCQGLFKSVVDLLATNFDKYYNERLTKNKVSLSFTSVNDLQKDNTIRHREFVEIFAHCLYSYFTKEKVYYDVEKDDSNNLKEDLEKEFKDYSEYVIVFVSEDYNTDKKSTTKIEWGAIKEKHESIGWKNVIFVPIENAVANSTSIGRILSIDDFSEKFVDFSDLRDRFYRINDLDQSCKGKMSDSECNKIEAYINICKDIQNRINEKIIKAKIKIEDY